MKVLITGKNGQLGSELQELSKDYPNKDFKFMDREDLPLDNIEGIQTVLDEYQPDVIINAGAYTAVDRAESEAVLADKINHLAVAEIANWALKNEKKLIHISTDYVFAGDKDSPYAEDEPTAPINEYGRSKLKGEEAILESKADAVIIRTAWVYSTYGANFVKTMLRLLNERDEISVVADQIGSPTYAKDLAEAIYKIAFGDTWHQGIYHYSNEGRISWYDFVLAIQKETAVECKINAITSDQYPTPAKRPHYSLLNKTKIKNTFRVKVPDWGDSLKRMLETV